MMKLEWNSSILASKGETVDSLVIKGVLLDSSVNKNGWMISEEDLPELAKQCAGVPLCLDHGTSVRDVIGGVKSGFYDPYTKQVMFEAEVDDPAIIRSITKGRLKYVSIGANAGSICSSCGKTNRPTKLCNCKGAHSIIKPFQLKEVSIITDPAYAGAEFSPVSFAAAVEKELESSLQIEDKKVISEEIKVEQTLEVKTKMEEKKLTDENKTETTVKASLDPETVNLIAKLVQKTEDCITKMTNKMEEETKKKETEEVKKKKSEEEEAKKKENAKFEETISALKQEIATLKQEKKKEPDPEEEEEEEKPKEAKKKETIGAKVETQKVITADAKPGNMVEAMWADVRKAAKDFGIIG